MLHHFRSRLVNGETLIGTMVTMPAATVAEILTNAGFDWLFVDGEHGSLEMSDILSILQAVGHQIPCIVRVPSCDEVAIKKVLDLGACGIIVPQVNTAKQARDVVRFARYAPDGQRGIGIARAQGYGSRFPEYLATANEQIAVIVQAEHAEAVKNIDEIASVEGIDAVFLGPYDLSASLGKTGLVNDPVVTEAIDRITAACQAAKLSLGLFGISADAVQRYMQAGYTLITVGTDTLFLANSATRVLAELK